MIYECLKIFHVVSAALLITSMAYCCQLWWKQNSVGSDRIQTQTWSIIVPFAVFQLATGFTMISLKHYDFSEIWIKGSVIGFIVVIISWFSFIYLLFSQRSQVRWLQTSMLIICTLSLLSMIFFMANRI